MTCDECSAPMTNGKCERCAAEDAIYASYRASIAVPEMWSAIDSRLRPRAFPWRMWAIAAALVLACIAAIITLRAPKPVPDPVTLVAAKYDRAIQALQPHAQTNAAVLGDLDRAVDQATRAAAQSPNDPIAVTRLVAAYDAKLEVLRATTYER